VLAALVSAVVAFGVVAGPGILRSQCSLASVRQPYLATNSFVTSSHGVLLGTIPAKQNRQQLALAQISPWLQKATVAIEDRRFWQHGALDYTGIVRAAWQDVLNWRTAQGASTLTQQLVRNLYIGRPSETLGRKVKEACLALRLAQQMTKKQILAEYLNVVYYGNQAYGVDAAAQTYFSRDASQVSVAQAALIAGLPQAPSVDDPFRDAKDALFRRNEVLHAMLVAGYLSPAAYTHAIKLPLGLHPGTLYKRIREPYFFGYVDQQLVSEYGQRLVEGGGLRVKTTIDLRLQRLAARAIRSHLHSKTDPSSALVAIDPRNGDVRAMAVYVPSGQRLQFNLATQSQRQAGSAFKPFTLAAALEHGISLKSYYSGPPQLTISDPRCSNGVNQSWDVHNNADEAEGTMSLIDATANSVNTIFAQLVTQVSPAAVVRMAHRAGIQSALKPVCSITLGTQAVDPLEMADAYATFAAHGMRHDPQAVESVRTASGQVLPFTQHKAHRAMSSTIADQVTYALEAVAQKGTGTAAALQRPIAGKTGTAEGFVDAWFCGYVPQLVTCVWVGYPHREVSMNDVEGYAPVYGGTIPALIWHDFMSGALWRVPVENFATPTITGTATYPRTELAAAARHTKTKPRAAKTAHTTSPAPPPPPPPAPPPAPPPKHGHGHGHKH
jgi:penicillin-binding protein 1A